MAKFVKVVRVNLSGVSEKKIDAILNVDSIISAERSGKRTWVRTTALDMEYADEHPTSECFAVDMPIDEFYDLIAADRN